ncbi:MAG: hypothetical protein KIT80_19200 [Chitinophagaceae bacterium]|nr:hypothetical protein [Chitinophagaceae bacterium]MCW5929055.1 hypothetical protein [Chitinophagaceae bacterium]
MQRMGFFILCIHLFLSLPVLSAQPSADSIRQLLYASPAPETHQKIELLIHLAGALNRDSTDLALNYANEAYLLSLEEDDRPLQIRSLIVLSEGYLYNDRYDQALQYAYTALDHSIAEKDKTLEAAACTRLAWVFFDIENADLAMEYHREAQRLLEELNDEEKQVVNLNAIGLTYLMKAQYDSAIVYFSETIQRAESIGATFMVTAGLVNTGNCYKSLGQYREALTSLRQVTQASGNRALTQAEALNLMAECHLMLQHYDSARALLEESRGFINSSTSNTKKELLLDNLLISSRLASNDRNFQQAYEYLTSYIDIREQIISKAKADEVVGLKLKRQEYQKEEQAELLAAERKLKRFQQNAFIVGFFLMAVIVLLVINRLRQRQRKEKELAAIRQALTEKDLQSAVAEKEILNNKLAFKNGELKNTALYISQRNEMTRQFIEELEVLKHGFKKESLSEFNRLINRFQYDLDLNRGVNEFNLAADEMHKDFLYNLHQQYPDLTESEKRLCLQIRLNLSIKDIASIRNISVKSVEMARYRLRRNFGLKHEESLNEFLSKF